MCERERQRERERERQRERERERERARGSKLYNQTMTYHKWELKPRSISKYETESLLKQSLLLLLLLLLIILLTTLITKDRQYQRSRVGSLTTDFFSM